jgi:hypothetical protein
MAVCSIAVVIWLAGKSAFDDDAFLGRWSVGQLDFAVWGRL